MIEDPPSSYRTKVDAAGGVFSSILINPMALPPSPRLRRTWRANLIYLIGGLASGESRFPNRNQVDQLRDQVNQDRKDAK
jgi:hypothetical protein